MRVERYHMYDMLKMYDALQMYVYFGSGPKREQKVRKPTALSGVARPGFKRAPIWRQC